MVLGPIPGREERVLAGMAYVIIRSVKRKKKTMAKSHFDGGDIGLIVVGCVADPVATYTIG